MKQCLFLILCFITIHSHSSAQWQKTNTNLNSHHKGIAFSDPLNGYMVGTDVDDEPWQNTGGKIFRTTDGGSTWEMVLHSLAQATQVTDIDFDESNSFLACNRQDLVFRSNDDGMTWDTTYFGGVPFVYKEIEMVNENIGYLVGWSGQIFKTEDGGDTWLEVYFLGTPYRSLECITCLSADTCFAGGNGELIVRTIDGGDTWETQRDETNLVIHSITHVSGEVLFAVGGSSTPGGVGFPRSFILKTEDLGMTWDSIAFPLTDYSNAFTDVAFSGNIGYAIGDYETIYKTTDQGNTWELIHQNNANIGFLNEIILFDSNRGIICGDYNTIFTLGISSSIFNLKNEALINIYPNPFSNSVHIESKNIIKNGKIIFFDSIGRKVIEAPWVNSNWLYLNNLTFQNGIYFYAVFEKGEEVFEGKIMKMK